MMSNGNPTPAQIRVVLADDHALLRQGVAYVLAAEPDIAVVGEAASAADALQLVVTLLPDVILLDITMPGGGLQAAQAISTSCPATKIVMLTASEDEEDMRNAVQAGACGYVLKGVPARELVRVLRAVAGGAAYVTPALAASLLPALPETAPAAGPLTRIRALLARRPAGVAQRAGRAAAA